MAALEWPALAHRATSSSQGLSARRRPKEKLTWTTFAWRSKVRIRKLLGQFGDESKRITLGGGGGGALAQAAYRVVMACTASPPGHLLGVLGPLGVFQRHGAKLERLAGGLRKGHHDMAAVGGRRPRGTEDIGV